jgi:capsular exopolysaccharide synthesis family protein
MSKQNTTITTLALPINANESNNAEGNIIKKYLFHWPLFALCTLVLLAVAYFYLKVTQPNYPILATIEFKSPTASSASLTVNQNSTETTLDPINKPIIVENEIEVMQSKKLIYQVVDELGLWITYTQKTGLFKKKDLYKASPVDFKFIHQDGTLPPAGVSLKVVIKDKNTFSCKEKNVEEKEYKFDTPVKSDFGTWQLNANDNIQAYVDSTLVIAVNDKDLVTDALQKGIKVTLENKDAPFLNLSYSDDVPQRGKDILNLLMAKYLKFAQEDKNKLSQKALKFVDARLITLKSDLDSVEKQIETYRISHNITDITAQASASREASNVNQKAINDIDLQLSSLSALERYTSANQDSNSLPPNPGLIDQNLTDLYTKLADLQIQRQIKTETLGPNNPKIVSTDEQIRKLKSDFNDKLRTNKITLLAQKKQLQSVGENIKSSLTSVPGLDRNYADLKRLEASKDTIYRFLLQRREQLGLRYASIIEDSEVIDDAHAGKVKWPIAGVVYALALVLGLGGAAGILYVRESLNDLIVSRKQIEDETDIPILGELAYQDTDKQIVVSEGRSKFAIGEQFRVLRTNLYHLHGTNNSGRVTLFTSSVSGEGKSFVSSNLAVTLAYASRKTIILEMDLRKPKVSVNFNLSPEHIGISNYLSGEKNNLAELIQPSGIAGLDVLGCGSILPNPSELLERDELDALIASLRTMYDDIIIDSPPIHLVTDALIIARTTDVSLYVVRQGYTHKYELEFANEINEAKRFPKFSIVFNGVKAGGSGYGGYGYGYGYGYGGYGSSGYNSYADKQKTSFGDIVKNILKRF